MLQQHAEASMSHDELHHNYRGSQRDSEQFQNKALRNKDRDIKCRKAFHSKGIMSI